MTETFKAGTKIGCTIEQSLPNCMLVTHKIGSRIFRGILVDERCSAVKRVRLDEPVPAIKPQLTSQAILDATSTSKKGSTRHNIILRSSVPKSAGCIVLDEYDLSKPIDESPIESIRGLVQRIECNTKLDVPVVAESSTKKGLEGTRTDRREKEKHEGHKLEKRKYRKRQPKTDLDTTGQSNVENNQRSTRVDTVPEKIPIPPLILKTNLATRKRKRKPDFPRRSSPPIKMKIRVSAYSPSHPMLISSSTNVLNTPSITITDNVLDCSERLPSKGLRLRKAKALKRIDPIVIALKNIKNHRSPKKETELKSDREKALKESPSSRKSSFVESQSASVKQDGEESTKRRSASRHITFADSEPIGEEESIDKDKLQGHTRYMKSELSEEETIYGDSSGAESEEEKRSSTNNARVHNTRFKGTKNVIESARIRKQNKEKAVPLTESSSWTSAQKSSTQTTNSVKESSPKEASQKSSSVRESPRKHNTDIRKIKSNKALKLTLSNVVSKSPDKLKKDKASKSNPYKKQVLKETLKKERSIKLSPARISPLSPGNTKKRKCSKESPKNVVTATESPRRGKYQKNSPLNTYRSTVDHVKKSAIVKSPYRYVVPKKSPQKDRSPKESPRDNSRKSGHKLKEGKLEDKDQKDLLVRDSPKRTKAMRELFAATKDEPDSHKTKSPAIMVAVMVADRDSNLSQALPSNTSEDQRNRSPKEDIKGVNASNSPTELAIQEDSEKNESSIPGFSKDVDVHENLTPNDGHLKSSASPQSTQIECTSIDKEISGTTEYNEDEGHKDSDKIPFPKQMESSFPGAHGPEDNEKERGVSLEILGNRTQPQKDVCKGTSFADEKASKDILEDRLIEESGSKNKDAKSTSTTVDVLAADEVTDSKLVSVPAWTHPQRTKVLRDAFTNTSGASPSTAQSCSSYLLHCSEKDKESYTVSEDAKEASWDDIHSDDFKDAEPKLPSSKGNSGGTAVVSTDSLTCVTMMSEDKTLPSNTIQSNLVERDSQKGPEFSPIECHQDITSFIEQVSKNMKEKINSSRDLAEVSRALILQDAASRHAPSDIEESAIDGELNDNQMENPSIVEPSITSTTQTEAGGKISSFNLDQNKELSDIGFKDDITSSKLTENQKVSAPTSRSEESCLPRQVLHEEAALKSTSLPNPSPSKRDQSMGKTAVGACPSFTDHLHKNSPLKIAQHARVKRKWTRRNYSCLRTFNLRSKVKANLPTSAHRISEANKPYFVKKGSKLIGSLRPTAVVVRDLSKSFHWASGSFSQIPNLPILINRSKSVIDESAHDCSPKKEDTAPIAPESVNPKPEDGTNTRKDTIAGSRNSGPDTVFVVTSVETKLTSPPLKALGAISAVVSSVSKEEEKLRPASLECSKSIIADSQSETDLVKGKTSNIRHAKEVASHDFAKLIPQTLKTSTDTAKSQVSEIATQCKADKNEQSVQEGDHLLPMTPNKVVTRKKVIHREWLSKRSKKQRTEGNNIEKSEPDRNEPAHTPAAAVMDEIVKCQDEKKEVATVEQKQTSCTPKTAHPCTSEDVPPVTPKNESPDDDIDLICHETVSISPEEFADSWSSSVSKAFSKQAPVDDVQNPFDTAYTPVKLKKVDSELRKNIVESDLEPGCSEGTGTFAVGDVVWGKVYGHPWWPGRILKELKPVNDNSEYQLVQVAWFGSRTQSTISTQVLVPFEEHLKGKLLPKKKGPYRTAVNEARKACQLSP